MSTATANSDTVNKENLERVHLNRTTTVKLQSIAEFFDDKYDFIDFWYNFNLWDEKERMDKWFMYWRNAVSPLVTLNDFFKIYEPVNNTNRFTDNPVKLWFVFYTQFWIFYRNITGKIFASFYGKDVMSEMINMYGYYHCYGELVFIEELEERYGKIE